MWDIRIQEEVGLAIGSEKVSRSSEESHAR